MASPPQPAERRVRAPAPPAAESVDILTKIFLLDCPADLARACASSPDFRRIITEPGFLRRFRALHPPPLLGICNGTFLAAEPPHPSAAAARKFVDDGGGAIDFTCRSFLPAGPAPWFFCESSDGRTLLTGKIQPGGCCGSHRSLCRPLVVCDPLHRRYVVLPASPEELAALVDHGKYLDVYKPFLAPRALDDDGDAFFSAANPPGEDDDDDGVKDALSQPSYRVMCLVQCACKLSLFVFSSSATAAGRPWRAIECDNWNAQGNDPLYQYSWSILRHSYVHGRFYYTIYPRAKKILVVDARKSTSKLSIMDSPPDSYCLGKTFVEAAGEQERLAMVKICKHDDKHQVFHLTYALLREEGGNQWEPEAVIYLPLRYNYYRFIGVAGGYLLLEGTPEDRDFYAVSRPDMMCFSFDLRTLQLERFCGSKYTFEYVSSYTGCPRYLSPPTV